METISTCSRTSESCLPSPYSLWPAQARPHLAVEQKPTPWRKRPAVGFRLKSKWFSACKNVRDFSVVSGIAFTSSEWQLKVLATMCEFNSMQRQVSNSCQFAKLVFVASIVFFRANAASSFLAQLVNDPSFSAWDGDALHPKTVLAISWRCHNN